MAKVLTKQQKANVRRAIFEKADEFGYSSSGRIESSRFMDDLVENPEIGGVLKEYMSKERIRTYIKDSELNAYAKKIINDALEAVDPTATIQHIYESDSSVIQQCTGKDARVSISRAQDGRIFVVSGGTVLKWETALRKALEIIAKKPGLTIEGATPSICLPLVAASDSLTAADKQHIVTALDAVGVKVTFVEA
jgi:hypothetical protein